MIDKDENTKEIKNGTFSTTIIEEMNGDQSKKNKTERFSAVIREDKTDANDNTKTFYADFFFFFFKDDRVIYRLNLYINI